MSEHMTPLPLAQLLDWIFVQDKTSKKIFDLAQRYKAQGKGSFLGEALELPMGPAAGPHTQLAQNIVVGYVAGARFFELKTVQTLDGADLAACISRPCILAQDEGYNVEWSTELTVEDAQAEYVKAWLLLSVLSKELSLGDMDGFQFSMSVGYDLEGISSEKIRGFLSGLQDASNTPIFQESLQIIQDYLPKLKKFKEADLANISPHICQFVTLSTLHGCPAEDIEKIASHLLCQHQIHTYIKCNPTLLGYDFVRNTLDTMGYGYISFGKHHFEEDLQYQDAVPMIQRLLSLAQSKNLCFGVKLTNTFPVDIKANELPGEEMYLSGKALYPLSLSVAAKLAVDFQGNLPMSFSGGADYFNIAPLLQAGIYPITLCTTLLKPGGYGRLQQLAQETAHITVPDQVQGKVLESLLSQAIEDGRYQKSKQASVTKQRKALPLFDCDKAPCQSACPIGQDTTAYLELCAQGLYREALVVILQKNPLPSITGSICPHPCADSCNRNYYDDPVEIPQKKLLAAQKAQDSIQADLKQEKARQSVPNPHKIAVIGAGPAGMAVSFFLSRGGQEVSLFEQEHHLGGSLRALVDQGSLSQDAIYEDTNLLLAVGVQVERDFPVEDLDTLQQAGFTHFVLALGKHPNPCKQSDFYAKLGLSMNEFDQVKLDRQHRSSLPHIFVIGSGAKDVGSVVESITQARTVADCFCQQPTGIYGEVTTLSHFAQRNGVLSASGSESQSRCLGCGQRCQLCIQVCPNRANLSVAVNGKEQVLHYDPFCNECGNCQTFCPHGGAPFLEKFTFFHSEEAFLHSKNPGFCKESQYTAKVRLGGKITSKEILDQGRLSQFIASFVRDYPFLWGNDQSHHTK